MSTSREAKGLISERMRARRLRIARIRRRALAAAAGTFVMAWGVLFVQLVSGHDPAVAQQSAVSTSNASSSAAPRTSSSGSVSGSSAAIRSAPASSGTATPVTTSQS